MSDPTNRGQQMVDAAHTIRKAAEEMDKGNTPDNPLTGNLDAGAGLKSMSLQATHNAATKQYGGR